MLEIPESYTLAKQLNDTIQGKVIRTVKANQSPHKFTWYAGNPDDYPKLMEGKTIADIWKEGVEQKLSGLALSKQDKEALIHFGSNLGYLDKDMQLSTIDLYIATLETEIEEATKTVKEKSYLYNSLGIMAGLFVTIILI